MADDTDGQSGIEEPSLPFEAPAATAPDDVIEIDIADDELLSRGESSDDSEVQDPEAEGPSDVPSGDDGGAETLDSGLQPEDDVAPEDDDEQGVDSTIDADPAESGTPEGESAEEAPADEDGFEIEVLDIETEPVVEMTAVPAPDADSDGDDADTDAAVIEDADSDSAGTDDEHLDALAEGPTALDDFSHDDYVAATTVEYQGLAEAIEAADQEDTQLQAVAVTMPGLESGVVGFEDVTGEQEQISEAPVRRSDLGLRIVTGLILMGMLVGAMLAGGGWLVAFVSLVGVIALGEFYGALRTAGYQPVALLGFLTLVAMMVAGFRYGPFGIVGWFTVGLVTVLLWYAVLVRRNPLANASLTILGMAWIGVLLAFIGPLAATANFRPMVLSIVLVVAALDVGSYFAGRILGRTKMSPVLSPNKTYEGLFGGVVLAAGMAIGLSYIEWFAPLDFRGALFLTGVAVALGPFGDLAVSMVKRQVGVKDMGSILPGHGGLLDRIDALLFIIPVAYFVFSWLGYFA